MRHRAVGIVIKDGKILLMHRLKNGREYYVFPGGGVEENENFEEALKREMMEELGVEISGQKLLFEFENELQGRDNVQLTGNPNEHYFLIKNFSGEPELGGPEKEMMNEQNQYYLEWLNIIDINIEKMPNLYPQEAVKKLSELLTGK